MTHYAISELLIVVAGTWAAQRMFKNKHRAAGLHFAVHRSGGDWRSAARY